MWTQDDTPSSICSFSCRPGMRRTRHLLPLPGVRHGCLPVHCTITASRSTLSCRPECLLRRAAEDAPEQRRWHPPSPPARGRHGRCGEGRHGRAVGCHARPLDLPPDTIEDQPRQRRVRVEHPTKGSQFVANQLRPSGAEVSPSGVRGVWQRRDLLKRYQRLLRFETRASDTPKEPLNNAGVPRAKDGALADQPRK